MNIGNDAMRLKKKLSDDLSSEHPIVSGERTEISKTNSPSNHYKESHIMHNPNAKREQSNNEPAFQIDQVVFQNKGSNPDDKTNPALDNSRVVYHVSQKPTEFDNIEVIFRFSDSEKIGYDFNSVINACPLIIEKINRTQNQPNVIIDMPDWVAPTDLLEFFFFYKNGIGHDFSIHISKLLLISDFFKNDALVDTLISKIIVPQLNLSSGIVFLEESFQRLNQQTEVSNSWFDLFFFCIETVSKNLMFYISNSEYSRTLLNLNIKVLEEIVEKYFYCVSTYNHIFHDEIHLYNATEPFNDYSEENLEYVFALLLKKRNLNDLIQLSISEYLNLSSKDIVTETSKLPKPSFFISIDGDFLNFYKESSLYITNSKQILSLIVYYRKADDSLNVSVKINENVKSSKYLILKAFTMLFTMNCNDDPERQSFSVLNLIYKVNYPLFSIKKFKQYFDRSRGESVNLKINLKFCHTHSAMITYMIRNFNKFSDNQLVPKLPKNLVANFIKHPLIKGKDDNNSLKFVINWMKSPMNQHEDMTEILNNIEWSNVNSELSFEFIIKFAYLLDRDEAFESKLRESIVNNVLTNFKKHSNHEIVESLVELLICKIS